MRTVEFGLVVSEIQTDGRSHRNASFPAGGSVAISAAASSELHFEFMYNEYLTRSF